VPCTSCTSAAPKAWPCPHYLLLNDKEVARIGALAKCAPPIRDEKRRKALWAELRAGRIHTIGSDHSPAPADMKTSPNFFEIWGGIAGAQHGFQLLFSECAETADTDLPKFAAAMARNVARRFRLDGRKGLLAPGQDADFCVIDFASPRAIAADDLWTRHRIGAYVGRKNRARVTDTYVRGNPIYSGGRLVNLPAAAQFLRPEK
jgi:allantoinase